MPGVLADLLGGRTITDDGRMLVPWFGSLPDIEERIANVTARIATVQAQLDSYLTNAAELLAAELLASPPSNGGRGGN